MYHEDTREQIFFWWKSTKRLFFCSGPLKQILGYALDVRSGHGIIRVRQAVKFLHLHRAFTRAARGFERLANVATSERQVLARQSTFGDVLLMEEDLGKASKVSIGRELVAFTLWKRERVITVPRTTIKCIWIWRIHINNVLYCMSASSIYFNRCEFFPLS